MSALLIGFAVGVIVGLVHLAGFLEGYDAGRASLHQEIEETRG